MEELQLNNNQTPGGKWMTEDKDKKDYTTPSPQELQKQLDERMAKFLAKGGKIEKVDPMVPTKEQLKSWTI